MAQKGTPSPVGATLRDGGANFSLFSRSATKVELVLFDGDAPTETIELDSNENRTYHYWHVFVPGVKHGQLYGYRVYGRSDPERGLAFNPSKILLDPYGRGVHIPDSYDPKLATGDADNAAAAMKSVVVDVSGYDWGDDAFPRTPAAQTVIYEMHAAGFTKNPNSGVAEELRGTYRGMIEKVPYLRELGVTAVELLPVHAFDPKAAPRGVNYWGYQSIGFFAPHPLFAADKSPGGAVDEFRDLVKALHKAGIEVILDVVFNHTAEGGDDGPFLSFRGIDQAAYYILSPEGSHTNYSGCGNTFSGNNAIARRLIVDSLVYWVKELHVDGFRFDLASILTRDECGHPVDNPPVLWDIETCPELAGTKLIAEAWDAGGLYQVGSFVGDYWREWNGRFRDEARDFFRGMPGAVQRFADRLLGSVEIYAHENREPEQSVNFVACHDGFTLNDVVTYDNKHNEANGEDNRDGSDDNKSWNCGVEGPTDDPKIEALRNRQVKNFLAVTIMAIGLPMIYMGDEVRHTQKGNNNCYAMDNELSWFDWDDLARHPDVLRFTKLLIKRRVTRTVEHERRRMTLSDLMSRAKITWHGVELNQPDWSQSSRAVALELLTRTGGFNAYMIFNSFWEQLDFELPPAPADRPWKLWFDTFLPTGEDIVDFEAARPFTGKEYPAGPRSVVFLFHDLEPESFE
ncbi:glycogen debranching protein GlgX [Hyaloraphidium curvatum]|nr:glycogen debranching protein GlgX [Hyaloraphidium curvatum]